MPHGAHPGCLVASYCYQEQVFSRDMRQLNRSALLACRERFHERFWHIAECYPPSVTSI